MDTTDFGQSKDMVCTCSLPGFPIWPDCFINSRSCLRAGRSRDGDLVGKVLAVVLLSTLILTMMVMVFIIIVKITIIITIYPQNDDHDPGSEIRVTPFQLPGQSISIMETGELQLMSLHHPSIHCHHHHHHHFI